MHKSSSNRATFTNRLLADLPAADFRSPEKNNRFKVIENNLSKEPKKTGEEQFDLTSAGKTPALKPEPNG